jgi:hypothetical protein
MASRRLTALLAGLVLATASCSASAGRPAAVATPLPQGGEPVTLDPARFTTRIDNPWFPMVPGTRWEYREGRTHVVVTVTHRTRKVAGVTARVVHDVDSRGGKLIEDTKDWYAQDADGNVWYLGEDTKEYRNGKVHTTEGSWEAGVDGAQAGVIMPARPHVGLRYRQEYYEGHAEDAARVLSLNKRVRVPTGSYRGVLQTLDYTLLQPGGGEHKHYARGVGPVLTTSSSGRVSEQLVRFKAGS